jgi:hypothetical protein
MRKALFIGIDNYCTAPLYGCINDATTLANILEKNEDESPNFEIHIERDVPTSEELLSIIDNFFAHDCNTALLYFAGHGIFNKLGGYIVTPDHSSIKPGVSMSDILVLANQSAIRDKIIILDCCHSGAFASKISGGGNIPIEEGISILTASRKNEPSEEINGRGVFTNLLIEALNGGAADISGNISPGSVYAFIDQALGAFEQRPVFKTNVTNFTSLRKVKPQVPLDVLRNITKYFPTQNHDYKLNPSYEDTNSDKIEHKIIEPQADAENVKIFKELQKFQSVGLIVPVDEEFMYFAAMNSKSCRLTALGYHYWRLAKKNKL